MLISVFWASQETFIILGRKNLNIIRDIIADYEKLIKTKIQIPLSNGDIIEFVFNPQDLPHLLGLQHLVDNPILFEYSERRLSASDLYNRMNSIGEDAIDTDEFENSIYFNEIYDGRIKYFSSELILDIIQAKQIVKFNPAKVKNFSTKLEKIEYMFWKRYKDKDNNYGYFGIGFISSEKVRGINYPNTFFFRMDADYISGQEIVLPFSFMKKDRHGLRTFKIYWDKVWQGLEKNSHYKKLKKMCSLERGFFDIPSTEKEYYEDVKRHYELLQLDALDKIYLPYMKEDFRWTNDEKRFILSKMGEAKKDLLPSDVKQLLNECRQKKNSFKITSSETAITKVEAKNAFYELREQAFYAPEMTLDEINAEISAVRAERKVKQVF